VLWFLGLTWFSGSLGDTSEQYWDCCRFGYVSNTKIKFILVTTDQDLRDADVRNVSGSILMYFVLKLLFLFIVLLRY